MKDTKTDISIWYFFQNNYLILLNNVLPQGNALNPILPYINTSYHFEPNKHCADLNPAFSLPTEYSRLTIREALSIFVNEDYRSLIKAYAIINWEKNHQFCSRCGVKTQYKPPVFQKICPSCQLSFFPRISPSIIVLIKKGDHILMARGPHFLPGVYGLIAGFVEAGETLEEATHREVYEEVGLTIKNLVYKGSQPWPFPDSLMAAFTADFAGGIITPDPSEIEEAGWYRYDNLPGLPSTKISIARKLIDEFVEGFVQ